MNGRRCTPANVKINEPRYADGVGRFAKLLYVGEAYVAIVYIKQSELACVSSKGHEDLYSEYDIEPPI